MSKRSIVLVDNSSGLSFDKKLGQKNSFAYSKHIDFRKSPSRTTVLPETTKETGSIVTDMVTDMVRLPSGKIVAIGDTGGVYIRTTGGVWSKHGTELDDTAFGAIYNKQQDRIIVPGQKAIHTINDADGRFGGTLTPVSNTFVHNVDFSQTGGANTYTTQSSINEGATHRLEWTPNYEPLYSVKVWVATKGTGDVTVTIHDSANNVVGSKTLTAAELTNGQFNEFIFGSSDLRLLAKPTGAVYHVHVTHNGAGTATTIGTTTASDFSTANLETFVSRLVTQINGFHPVAEFLQYICVGNERYLMVWEPISQSEPSSTEMNRHRLIFPQGYEVNGLAVWNEYLAISTERRASSATNGFQDGKIFFWDGISTTYNFFIDIPEGSPYGIFSHKNILYYMADNGLWAWSGGAPVLVFELPNTDYDFSDGAFYSIMYPKSMAVFNRLLHFGFPSETNSQNPEHGIYTFGSRNRLLPDSFGFDHTISSGMLKYNGSDEIRIGGVWAFGSKLFTSWRDDEAGEYGVDIVDPNSDPYGNAEYQSREIDNGRPDKDKLALEVIVTFDTLPTGATVTPKYKIDGGNWVTGTATNSGQKAVLNINQRYKVIQVGYDLVATNTTPEILSVTLIFDDNAEERD